MYVTCVRSPSYLLRLVCSLDTYCQVLQYFRLKAISGFPSERLQSRIAFVLWTQSESWFFAILCILVANSVYHFVKWQAMSNELGYASRRNGSCLSTENDCGVTVSPFHACCPGNTFCPAPQYNVMCCPSNASCSDIIGKNCADEDDILYTSDSKDITNGGFCCAKGKYAYKTEDDSVGCADALSDLQTGMAQLPVISSPTRMLTISIGEESQEELLLTS